MSDLMLTQDDELGVAQVEGNTEAGIEFVDAYLALELVAVDAGRIIIPASGVWALEERARLSGLTLDHESV